MLTYQGLLLLLTALLCFHAYDASQNAKPQHRNSIVFDDSSWSYNESSSSPIHHNTTIEQSSSIGNILVAFYHATDGPNWKHQDGWSDLSEFTQQKQVQSLNYCSFYGIMCSNNDQPQKVEVIGLAGNQLRGTIPAELWTLPGLQAVDLSYNDIEISAFASSPLLRRLRLSYTNLQTLSGIDQLSRLEELFVDGCPLHGSSSSSNATNDTLLVNNNKQYEDMLQTLPVTLQSLHMQASQLQGTIPNAFGRRMTHLRHLHLNENDLTGTLPATLGWLFNLQSLDLSDNSFESTLPMEWNNLRSLQTLQLNRMGLTGPLPTWNDLARLDLFEAMENALSGMLPNRFLEQRQISSSSSSSHSPLTIRLTSNHITGSIPTSFLNFQKLHLELMDNHITFMDQAFCEQREWMSGQVGQWLDVQGAKANGCDAILCPTGTYNADGRVSDVTRPCLMCPDNPFMGDSFCEANITMNEEVLLLNELFVATGGNHWAVAHVNWTKPGVPLCYREGVVCGWPTPEMNSGVTELRLKGFGLRGTVASSIYQLPRLRELEISFNPVDVDFRGIEQASILEIVKLTKTEVLSLEGFENAGPLLHELHWDTNFVEGPLPVDILKQVTSLRKLFLNNNRFTGTLPSDLFESLTNLVTLSMHDNPGFTGSLPTTMGLLKDLQIFDSNACGWSGTLPTQLEQLTDLRRISLSQNLLEGPLLAFPRSTQLSEIYLSRNKNLDGRIPSELLSGVEASVPLRVDFAFNRLTGSLPSELLRFQILDIDVVGNELTGLLDVCDGGFDGISSNWMNGAIAVASPACDAIACRPGYSSLYGRVIPTNVSSTCQPCAESNEAPFYGSIHCLDLTAQRERRALVSFYEATQGTSGWITDTNWLSDEEDSVCSWFGVVCDKQKQHVTRLYLENNGLSLVDSSIDVMQLISEGLPHLEQLDLKGNSELNLRFTNLSSDWMLQVLAVSATNLRSLKGLDTLSGSLSTLLAADNALQGEIPTEVYALTALKQLFLSYNQLSGSLSSEIGLLSTLESLYWSNNMLSGTLPTELAKLTNLRHLIMNENSLQGSLPTALSEMSSLEQLWLQQQNGKFSLSGRLPSFANAAQLWYLDLSSNGFTGSLPTTFLKHSQRLDDSIVLLLQNNDLTGTVPTDLTQFKSLYIDLGDNKITELPPVLCENKNWMNGDLVPGSCDYLLCPPATYHPAGRQLSPDEPCIPCPAELTEMNTLWGRSFCMEIESEQWVLEKLYLSTDGKSWTNHTNWMSDLPICSWYGIACGGDQNDNDGVIGIELAENALRGTLPAQLWALPLLSSLDVKNNPELVVDFRGTSILTSISVLQQLNVANSNLAYGLKGLTHFKGLENFTATHVTGRFPSEFLELGQLHFLNLTNCHLVGPLPTFEIPRVPQWKQFYAPNNDFHGSIPDSWGHLSLLEELVLDGNLVSGSLPSSVANLPRLRTLSLKRKGKPGQKLSGAVPNFVEAQQLENLFLSFNDLSGPLPDDFVQSAFHIHSIDMSHNAIQGTLPSTLDLLPSNLSLLMEENQISGVPLELCDNDNWMLGRVGQVGSCQAILCPPKTWAPTGRSVDEEQLCRPCEGAYSATPYYGSTKCQPMVDERSILVELYQATRGPDWVRHDFWNTPTDICQWYGVACDSKRRVLLLNLEHNGLLGTLPSSLWRLPKLQYLNLSFNQLIVSLETSYQAENLLDLRLSATGRVDDVSGVARLSTLAVLDLSTNGLSGVFPTAILQVSNLRILKLQDNLWTGPIPPSFASLQQLRVLELQQNSFTGSVPAFSLSFMLERINLSQNSFKGSLPTDFLSHVPLVSNKTIHINLSHNALTGALPESLARFDSLNLTLSGNQITLIPPALCQKADWNDGAVGPHGCNGILCPPLTYNANGYQSTPSNACRPCQTGVEPSAAKTWYGQTTCLGDVSSSSMHPVLAGMLLILLSSLCLYIES